MADEPYKIWGLPLVPVKDLKLPDTPVVFGIQNGDGTVRDPRGEQMASEVTIGTTKPDGTVYDIRCEIREHLLQSIAQSQQRLEEIESLDQVVFPFVDAVHKAQRKFRSRWGNGWADGPKKLKVSQEIYEWLQHNYLKVIDHHSEMKPLCILGFPVTEEGTLFDCFMLEGEDRNGKTPSIICGFTIPVKDDDVSVVVRAGKFGQANL